MAYIFARMKRKLELCCKIKDNNLIFWFDEFVSWWVDNLGGVLVFILVLQHKGNKLLSYEEILNERASMGHGLTAEYEIRGKKLVKLKRVKEWYGAFVVVTPPTVGSCSTET